MRSLHLQGNNLPFFNRKNQMLRRVLVTYSIDHSLSFILTKITLEFLILKALSTIAFRGNSFSCLSRASKTLGSSPSN